MPATTQFNPLLWQNANLDDPSQIREFMRQLIPYLGFVQKTLVPAGPNNPGLLNPLSGNATDYVGGDNKCHSLSGWGDGRYILRAGDTLPAGANFSFAGNLAIANGGQLYIQNGGTLTVQTGGLINLAGGSLQTSSNGAVYLVNETGLAAASYNQSLFRVYCANSGSRPGLAFWHGGLGYACFLYYETNGKMRFIDAGGVIHEITSS